MKGMGKYFIGVLPPPAVETTLYQLKEDLKSHFQVKYALQSHSHLTLKMPFRYKEGKERELVIRLTSLLEEQEPFPLQLMGIGHFGLRNIYHQLAPSSPLIHLQSLLRGFCKRYLHLVEELSDRNFQPHFTLAYKDLKAVHFEEVLAFAKKNAQRADFLVDRAYLLKNVESRWKVVAPLIFGVGTGNPMLTLKRKIS
ncbi:MAG: 2'-5' RNA ligase family protein [Bacteroidetes bacterium]|nr:2'-5' RNA ligase family protein [Bacteroidota bacterium]